ncbi:uncharacterized protein DDB_G0271670-like [Oppia nitens]|uniref:uncharacterized protein DDB_G0271670-like n=1 Tax=Oppia nitens TaxID=1686743 RepID=UPI0023DBC645|nr:uncharacterized protein DDB_G0271670-like [Oppia nitens]
MMEMDANMDVSGDEPSSSSSSITTSLELSSSSSSSSSSATNNNNNNNSNCKSDNLEEEISSSSSSSAPSSTLSSSSSSSTPSANTTTITTTAASSVRRKFRSLTFGRRKKSSSSSSSSSSAASTLQCLANTKCKQQSPQQQQQKTTNTCDNCGHNNNNNKTNINHSSATVVTTTATTNGRKKKSLPGWVPFKLCARTESCADVSQSEDQTYSKNNNNNSCICTAYKKTTGSDNGSAVVTLSSSSAVAVTDSRGSGGQHHRGNRNNLDHPNGHQSTGGGGLAVIKDTIAGGISTSDSYVDHLLPNNLDANNVQPLHVPPSVSMSEVRSVQVRVSELALALRSQLSLTVNPHPYLARWGEMSELTPGFFNRFCVRSDSAAVNSATAALTTDGQQIHTQIDYIHCLVPDLLAITNCSFYWGKMDRYEAERLIDNKPEGTFLLRDSAQEDHLFSVSFRRFDRSLHARIEQWNHKFSFDSHDPGVYSSPTVCGLIEHYKDPQHCMFFEPMLTIPLHRNLTFSLQHLSRAAITSRISYDNINSIQLPKRLKNYLKEYHYKQQVRVRRLDGDH